MATSNSKFRLPRDPVFYTNLVAALVMFASTFLLNLSPEVQGAVNAVAFAVAGLWVGWKVSDGQLALLVNLFKALIALAISFGLHWTDGQQLVLMTLVTLVASAFVRTQVGAPVPPPAATAQLTAVVDPNAVMKAQR